MPSSYGIVPYASRFLALSEMGVILIGGGALLHCAHVTVPICSSVTYLFVYLFISPLKVHPFFFFFSRTSSLRFCFLLRNINIVVVASHSYIHT